MYDSRDSTNCLISRLIETFPNYNQIYFDLRWSNLYKHNHQNRCILTDKCNYKNSVFYSSNQFFLQSRHLLFSGVFSFSKVTMTSREPQLVHWNLKSGYFGLVLKELLVFSCRTTCSALTDFILHIRKNFHLMIFPNYNQISFFINIWYKLLTR